MNYLVIKNNTITQVCTSVEELLEYLEVNVTRELENKGFKVEEYTSNLKTDVVRIDSQAKSFEETIEEIKDLTTDDELYIAALIKYPFLEESINKLGFDKIIEMKCIITNIKREIIKVTDNSKETKVMKNLKLTNEFSNGNFITAKRAKDLISKYYNEFEIQKTANIKDFYIVKESIKWIDNKTTKGYIVIIPKIILN